MPVKENVELKWEKVDIEKIKKILIEKHEFSEERVNSQLEKLKKEQVQKQQKGLGDFL